MNIDRILDVFRAELSLDSLEVRDVPDDETIVALPSEEIHRAVHLLVERFDLRHLSTITGVDIGDEIELLYHFWAGRGLTLRTSLPKEDPHIATLTDVIPGASFYEREVWEMLGVTFDGHPNLQRLFLPEDWGEGSLPLRREEEK